MSIKNVKKWMDTAEIGSSVIYYTGNLAEDRCYAGVHYDKDVAVIPNAFAEYAKDKKVDFFQKRKTKVDKSQTPKRPILDYIVRKIK
jgi:hypothetical protein|tara:strand:+ start:559 stop:819 length:261 start_codon:yes stop_codon:yes gene_type:complete